jgi:hypothetical protein
VVAVCWLMNGLVAMVVVAAAAEVRMQVLALDLHLEQHYHPRYQCHRLIYCVSLVLLADRQRLIHLRHRNHQGS